MNIASTLLIITATIFLSACGGGPTADSGGSPTADSDVKTGQFKDSIVKGLSYETVTQSGVTDEKGAFKYKAGEMVSFKIGAMEIGSADGADILYPRDIVENDLDGTKAIKIAQVLQTLDKDSDPDNEGIDITGQFNHEATKNEDIQTANLQALVADINKSDRSLTLVTYDKAKKHMDATIFADTRPTFESISNQDDIDSRIGIDNGRLKLSPETSEIIWLLAKSPTEITSLSANIKSPNLQLVLELKDTDTIDYFRVGVMEVPGNCMPDSELCTTEFSPSVIVVNSMYYGELIEGLPYSSIRRYDSKFNYYTKETLDKNTVISKLCIEDSNLDEVSFTYCPIDINLTIGLDKENKRVFVKFNDKIGYYNINSDRFDDLSTVQTKFFISDYTKPNDTAAKFVDNVKINNLDFDDFSSPTLDTTKWKTGKFSYIGK